MQRTSVHYWLALPSFNDETGIAPIAMLNAGNTVT